VTCVTHILSLLGAPSQTSLQKDVGTALPSPPSGTPPLMTAHAEGLAPSYVHALHKRLSQICSDAVHDGVLGRNPCSRRTSPPVGQQKPYVATTAQVWALHDAVSDHLRVAVLLGAFAGLRLAEASGLRVADVDFIRGAVHPVAQ
jgi:integrase